MENSSAPLAPTFIGHVATTPDATVLIEAVLRGHLNPAPRRPHDRERPDLIKSGSVFIYEEHASGIKRWTDGVSWSPSRILGNFLIYRELDRPFPPGEKKRALKKSKKKPCIGISKPEPTTHVNMPYGAAELNTSITHQEQERSLVGSLTDSYDFKPNGLMKKTISFSYQGVPHHLVSYYNVKDVISGKLMTPSECEQLRNIVPRPELLFSQSFRAPIEEIQYIVPNDHSLTPSGHPISAGGSGIIHRAMAHGNMVHGSPVHGSTVHGGMVHGDLAHNHRDVSAVPPTPYSSLFPPTTTASSASYSHSLLGFHYNAAQQTPYTASHQGNYAPQSGPNLGHGYDFDTHPGPWNFDSPSTDPHSQWTT